MRMSKGFASVVVENSLFNGNSPSLWTVILIMAERKIKIVHFAIQCLSIANVGRQVFCQPTNIAMIEPTRAVCIKLLTKENAFFDPATELMFKCSAETCPGVFGCYKCCPNLSDQAHGPKVHPSQNKRSKFRRSVSSTNLLRGARLKGVGGKPIPFSSSAPVVGIIAESYLS